MSRTALGEVCPWSGPCSVPSTLKHRPLGGPEGLERLTPIHLLFGGLQSRPLTQRSGWPPPPRAHLLIGLPPPCPWRTEKVSLFPNGYKVPLEPSCPLPFLVFIFHDFSGLQEVINCFGLKALLLGRSLRGRIKVNKQKGTESSKACTPTFLHYEEGNAAFAAGAADRRSGQEPGASALFQGKPRVIGS